MDDVFLGIDTAVPMGLIVNELVSNALKHAFPEDRKGKVRIELQTGEEDRFYLSVGDDGVGIPTDVDFRNPETLGLKLVDTLATQLRSQVELDRNSGTSFTIVRS